MAHIILKTMKSSLQAKQPISGEPPVSDLQPMVIDFSKHRSQHITGNIVYALFGALASFLLTSLLALFILGDQINHLWRGAQHATAEYVKITQEPEVAFPATTITPLPSKAFIMGKDFQKTKSPDKLELVPMLEKLPAYALPSKPVHIRNSYVEVETAPALSQSNNLQQQADDAVANGQTGKAIELYLRALRLKPNDANLRSNCVALLLEQARSFDELHDAPHAITAYKRAQSLWQGDAQTAQSIKARIEFLEQN